MTEIRILCGIEGAEQAEGTAVIIDVFRAFTLEAYLYAAHAKDIYAVASVEEALDWKQRDPSVLLCGERDGKICPGFDFGNSPGSIAGKDFSGKTIIHTTTNGVQGIASAGAADEVLTGSLVNAQATADYIRKQNPELVSLVCMGWKGRQTEEDQLCADYLKALIEGKAFPELEARALALKEQEGKKFFDPAQQDVFPEADFWMCIRHDLFSFVIRAEKEGTCYHNRKLEV